MKFIAIKNFSSIRFGNVSVGDIVELDKSIARQMIDAGVVELTTESRMELRQREIIEQSKKPTQKTKK